MALTKLNSASVIERLPVGSVLQVVQIGAVNDYQNTASATWNNTFYSFSITPSATSSKILVHFHIPYTVKGSGAKVRGAFRLQRIISSGATTLIWNTASNDERFQVRGTPDEICAIASMEYLDSPSTTSSVTYTMQSIRTADSGMNFITANGTALGGNAILKEIKG